MVDEITVGFIFLEIMSSLQEIYPDEGHKFTDGENFIKTSKWGGYSKQISHVEVIEENTLSFLNKSAYWSTLKTLHIFLIEK